MDVNCFYDQMVNDSMSYSSMANVPSSRVSSTSVISADVHSENGVEAESKKLPSSKYKGVVPQPNGRWGAQIYEKHQRVWLGTFAEEEEAAKVYDVAAIRFRGQNAVTNFKTSLESDDLDYIEKMFLSSHSKAEIVDMLRKHTYEHELEQSKQNYACYGISNNQGISDLFGSNTFQETLEFLFEKVLTPSDIGKLNRMVIPKQQAEKHFALNSEISPKGMLLNFEDNTGKVWRLRYCYWGSSQSYVLTKGWSRFVKENSLKAGDLVSFWRSNIGPNSRLFINNHHHHHQQRPQNGSGFEEMQSQQAGLLNPVQTTDVVRLFGVNISEKPNRSCKSKKKVRKIRDEISNIKITS